MKFYQGLFIFVIFLFNGCDNIQSPIELSKNEQIDQITLNSYTKTITLQTNEQIVLNDTTTTLNQFNDIKINSENEVEVIANYGDLDVIVSNLSLKGRINWVNIVIINYNPYPVDVNIELYKF